MRCSCCLARLPIGKFVWRMKEEPHRPHKIRIRMNRLGGGREVFMKKIEKFRGSNSGGRRYLYFTGLCKEVGITSHLTAHVHVHYCFHFAFTSALIRNVTPMRQATFHTEWQLLIWFGREAHTSESYRTVGISPRRCGVYVDGHLCYIDDEQDYPSSVSQAFPENPSLVQRSFLQLNLPTTHLLNMV